MKFEWLVARRYLRSPHRPAVLRLVTLLAVAGGGGGGGPPGVWPGVKNRLPPTIPDPPPRVTCPRPPTPAGPGPGGLAGLSGAGGGAGGSAGRARRSPSHLPARTAPRGGPRPRHGVKRHRPGP